MSWGRVKAKATKMFLISKPFLEEAHFCYSEIYLLLWNGGWLLDDEIIGQVIFKDCDARREAGGSACSNS